MLLLDWALPLPITENLLEGMPVSALLPIKCHHAMQSQSKPEPCFSSNHVFLMPPITAAHPDELNYCFVPGQCLILPSLWAHFKAKITCSTEYQKQDWINSRAILKHGNLAWKHFPRMNLVRAHPCACCPGSLGSW